MRTLSLVLVLVLTSGCSPVTYVGSPRHGSRPAVRQQWIGSPVGRWDSVVGLRRHSLVAVLTRDGNTNVGRFAGADWDALFVHAGGSRHRIERGEVLRIDLVEGPRSAIKAAAKGAVAGGLYVATLVFVFSLMRWDEHAPIPSGTVAKAVAGGAVGGALTADIEPRPRTIYIAPQP
jgi:hypothetical protein